MTTENDFLQFANGGGANVLSQAAYAALAAVANGYSSGLAASDQCNKTWRQSATMANIIAQLIIQETAQPVIDDGSTATILANLTSAINTLATAAATTVVAGSGKGFNPSGVWLDETGSRSTGSVYHNTTGFTICLNVTQTYTSNPQILVDSASSPVAVGVQGAQYSGQSEGGLFTIVPPGFYFEMPSGPTIQRWLEFR